MTRSRELAELASAYDSGSSMGFRNRIINGDMRIDQRNAGTALTLPTASVRYVTDRWAFNKDTTGATVSVRQSPIAPSGFVNSALITVSTGANAGAADQNLFQQIVEGFNVSDLGWGTANALSATISFWARSSITGTYGLSISNNAANRAYLATYTIDAANTFEFKTITIPGDTVGTWLIDNSAGIRVRWDFGSGSSKQGAAGSWGSTLFNTTSAQANLIGTSGATFYITGVQLEAGAVATPFERRDYGRELMMCQRYALVLGGESIYSSISTWSPAITSTQAAYTTMVLPVKMRALPSVAISGAFRLDDGYAGNQGVTGVGINTDASSSYVVALSITVASGLTAGKMYQLQTNGTTSRFILSSEL